MYEQRFALDGGDTRITGYVVVVCRPCGAVFADGIPSQADLSSYYRESSKYEYVEQAGEQPDWQLHWHAEVVESLVHRLPNKGAHIVDIGCANADLLGMLRERGYLGVLGVDPAPGSAVAAARLHGVRVVAGDTFSLPMEAESADCVILSAVLEHVRDVRRALTAVVGTLTPSGMLYVEVPDLERFPQHAEPPFQQFSLEHINFFTARSLVNAASGVGLECLDLRHETRRVGPVEEPSVCAMFRRGEKVSGEATCDSGGSRAVREYVAASLVREQGVRDRIGRLVEDHRPVILWGVGTHALHLLATTPLEDAEIVALVDANPRMQGQRVHGRVVVGPESVALRSEPLLICSPLRQEEIVAMARERFGMANQIISLYGPSEGFLPGPDSGQSDDEMPHKVPGGGA